MSENDDSNAPQRRRRALGRGLGALIPGQPAGSRPREFMRVNVAEIEPAAHQPRRDFGQEALDELADSIESSGLIQPLVVRRKDDGEGFVLIAGERRWRACQLAQVGEVPVVVKDVTDAEAFALALVENIQRQDLNPVEEAAAYARLMEEHGYTQAELADEVGKSRSAVANAVRLLSLPQDVCDRLASGELSAGHARALVGLTPKQARDLASRVIQEDLTVRETERAAKRLKKGEPEATSGGGQSRYRDDAQTRHLTNQLQHALGTRVRLRDKHGKGKVEIFYDDYEILQAVLDRLGVSSE